jgi:hypothetical protein
MMLTIMGRCYMEFSLGTWILIISTVLYVGAGIAFAFEGKLGLSIAYVAYAIANVGLMIVAIQGQ